MKNPNQLSFLKTDALGNPVTDASAQPVENTPLAPERSGYRIFVPASNINDIGKAIQAGGLKHFDDVTDSDRALMRQCLTGITTDDIASPLESFLRDALDCELLLTAYFYPKRFEGLPPSCHPGVMPVTWAVRAAGRAQRVMDIAPSDQRLAYVATLLKCSGLLYCAKDQDLQDLPVLPMGSDCFRLARLFLLDEALLKLRVRDEALADTLAAILDLPHGELYDLDQVTSISAAAYLASIRLTGIWAPFES